jgi:hypothetical protein
MTDLTLLSYDIRHPYSRLSFSSADSQALTSDDGEAAEHKDFCPAPCAALTRTFIPAVLSLISFQHSKKVLQFNG